MAVIFKIGTIDYSEHVVAEGYNVNYEPLLKEWTDGAQVKHRDVIGRKIRGKFTMYFEDATAMQTFLDDVESRTASTNACRVNLKVNNADDIDALVDTYVFIDFKPVRKNTTGSDRFDTFEVTVEEP